MARLSAEIGNPRGYINQAARAGSRLVQARLGTYVPVTAFGQGRD